MNVDHIEIDKFNRLAILWWDTVGPMRMLHVINLLRTSYVTERLSVKGLKILDVGCGGGIFTESLTQAGAIVTGIDLSVEALAVAKQHAIQNGLDIEYRLDSVEKLAEMYPGHYDIVCCMEMLEHVPDPARIVSACAQLTKTGGSVFFSTINRNFKAWLCALLIGEYVLGLLPKGTHHYAKLIKPVQLNDWGGHNHLQLKDTVSFVYNPWRKTFRLKPNADINYMNHYEKK